MESAITMCFSTRNRNSLEVVLFTLVAGLSTVFFKHVQVHELGNFALA